MRLLNVKTRTLEQYFNNIPNYAILSHRWGEEEVTLQDLSAPAYQLMRGYAKVNGFCVLAAEYGFDYVWIDACCIDKTSSAELSEAINSMFRWYENASACYAYLDDVGRGPADESQPDVDGEFKKSLWFTRGWTLQELLAPKCVLFYDKFWRQFGDRYSLAADINAITNIPISYLRREQDFRTASIAVRMSWAAYRETTRIEDRAYALLGIFNVNMPLLYGEGDRAFERLQLELLKLNTDESVLAWSPLDTALKEEPSDVFYKRFRIYYSVIHLLSADPQETQYSKEYYREVSHRPEYHRLLAQSPRDFACWSNISAIPMGGTSSVPEMTSRGLRITLPLFQLEKLAYGLLDCQIGTDFRKVVAIPLFQTAISDEYIRPKQPPCLLDLPWSTTRRMQYRTIYIRKDKQDHRLEQPIWNTDVKCGFVRLDAAPDLPERLVKVIPTEADKRQWSSVCPVSGADQTWKRILLHYSKDDGQDDGFVVVLERRTLIRAIFSRTMVPPPFVCHIVAKKKDQSLEDMSQNFDKSKAGDLVVCPDGPRSVTVRRDAFLKHEMFIVTISSSYPSCLPIQTQIFRAPSRGLFAGAGMNADAASSYVYKSCMFSWREFYFVPITILSWALLSSTVSKAEIAVLAGYSLSYFAIRLKARHAAHAIHVSNVDTSEYEVAFRYWPLDMAFVVCFTFINVFIFIRCYRLGEDNTALLGLHLLSISIWGQRPRTLGTPWRERLVKTWLRSRVFALNVSILLLILSFYSPLTEMVAKTG